MGSLEKEELTKLLLFYYQFTKTDEEYKVVSIGRILKRLKKKTYNVNKLLELASTLEYQERQQRYMLPRGATDINTAEFLSKVKHYLNREEIEIKSLTIVINI